MKPTEPYLIRMHTIKPIDARLKIHELCRRNEEILFAYEKSVPSFVTLEPDFRFPQVTAELLAK